MDFFPHSSGGLWYWRGIPSENVPLLVCPRAPKIFFIFTVIVGFQHPETEPRSQNRSNGLTTNFVRVGYRSGTQRPHHLSRNCSGHHHQTYKKRVMLGFLRPPFSIVSINKIQNAEKSQGYSAAGEFAIFLTHLRKNSSWSIDLNRSNRWIYTISSGSNPIRKYCAFVNFGRHQNQTGLPISYV